MRKLKDYFIIALKGACMGAADVIPGVSGGTIAFIMGIYDEFVGSIARIDKSAVRLLFKGRLRDFWTHINGNFLLSLLTGIGFSVVALAGLMQMLLSHFPIQTWAFFFGLIVASSIIILRGVSGWRPKDVLMLVFGVVLGAVICTLSPTSTPDALWFVFLSGALAICAMILPGISGSFILLILGKYELIMSAIAGAVFNVGALWGAQNADSAYFMESVAIVAAFLVGAVVGILGFSKFLNWLLSRWHRNVLIVMAGFIIGSLVKIWPWSNQEAIVLSQFQEARDLRYAADQLVYGAQEELMMFVQEHASMTDPMIGAAVIFALVGFGLVMGIELASARR